MCLCTCTSADIGARSQYPDNGSNRCEECRSILPPRTKDQKIKVVQWQCRRTDAAFSQLCDRTRCFFVINRVFGMAITLSISSRSVCVYFAIFLYNRSASCILWSWHYNLMIYMANSLKIAREFFSLTFADFLLLRFRSWWTREDNWRCWTLLRPK